MLRVKIFGACGYGGVGMIELLVKHPEAQIVALIDIENTGLPISAVYPHLTGFCDLPIISPEDDNPEDGEANAIFFATPDVLAGLFTLANFDRPDSLGVITPMGAGCASIINYPMEESRSESPRCILGMFDVSARPHVPEETLTFSIPIKRFEKMVYHMDESFLITGSWGSVKLMTGSGFVPLALSSQSCFSKP